MADGYEGIMQGYSFSSTQPQQFTLATSVVSDPDVSDAYVQSRHTDAEKPSRLESTVSQADYLGFDTKEYAIAHAESSMAYGMQASMLPSPMAVATYNGMPLDFRFEVAVREKELEK